MKLLDGPLMLLLALTACHEARAAPEWVRVMDSLEVHTPSVVKLDQDIYRVWMRRPSGQWEAEMDCRLTRIRHPGQRRWAPSPPNSVLWRMVVAVCDSAPKYAR